MLVTFSVHMCNDFTARARNLCSSTSLFLYFFLFATCLFLTSAPRAAIASQALTAEQQAWISKSPVIKVGGSPDWMPFNFSDKNGIHQGIARDYLDLISKKTGLQFEYSIARWEENLHRIKQRKIDVLPAVYFTKERSQFLNFSMPYFEMLDYFFVRDDLRVETLADLNDKRVALPKGYAHIGFIQQHFPALKIVLVDSFSAALDAVLENRADLLYDTYGSLIYTLREQGINSIIPFKSTRHLGERHIYFATRKDWPQLAKIIDAGLKQVSALEKQAIAEKWLGSSRNMVLELSNDERLWIKRNPIVKYGAERDWAPYDFVDNQGRHTGISKHFLDEISKLTGLKFQPFIANWNTLLQQLKTGQLDLLPAIYYTEERSRVLLFTEPYQSMMDYIFTHDDYLDENNTFSLNGKTVAIPKGYSNIDYLREHYPQLSIMTVDNLMTAIEKLIEKKADVIVESYPVVNYLLNKHNIAPIQPLAALNPGHSQQLYMAVNNHQQHLHSIINKALRSMNESQKRSIINKWKILPVKTQTRQLKFTPAEQQWLNNHPVINLGSESNWPPFEFTDNTGQHKGLSIDVARLLEKKLGIKFNIIEEYSWNETLTKLRHKEIDVVGSIVKTPERLTGMAFTDAYIAPPTVVYTRKDAPPLQSMTDLQGKKIAIENGYYLHEKLRNDFPELDLHVVDDTATALKAVSYGLADAYLGNQGASNWLIEQNALTNLHIAMGANFGRADLRFAVRKDWPQLQSLINKALHSISNEEFLGIRRKWLGLESKQNKLELSASERNWLRQHNKLRFAGDPNWLPYEAIDKNGNYIGIVAEYLHLIKEELGLDIEYINTRTWSETVAKFQKGEIDMISETIDTPLQGTFTRPYLRSPIVIVMNKDQDYVESITQIYHQKLALIKNYGYVSSIKSRFPRIEFVEVNDIQEGLTAVSTGKIDALLATLAQASYHIADLGINNIRIVGKTQFSTELAFGLNQKYAPLADLINRALDQISLTEKQKIKDNWSKQKFVTTFDYQLIMQIVAGFLFVLAIFIFWTVQLSREIRRRKVVEEQTQMLIDNIPLHIIVTNLQGEILSANPQALQDFKVDVTDINQYRMEDFYQNKTDRHHLISEIRQQGKIEQKIIPFKKLNGEIRSMMISVMPINYQNIDALLTIAVDMTRRVEIENALNTAKENAEASNRAKSSFLANMSHEIRTPMNAIIGFTDLLSEQIQDPRLKSYVNTIQSAGKNLLAIINDILDLSKIEAGKLDIQKTVCNPHDVFAEMGEIFMIKIREKNLDFIMDVDPNIPDNLLLDATRLRQILLNLIGNAVKFTDNGFIRLIARTVNEDQIRSKLDLIIEVEDSGVGVSIEHQQRIFQEFEQPQEQDFKKYGGTGLGLTISRRLTKMMGGELSLTSELNQGSTFSLHLAQVDIAPVANNHLPSAQDFNYEVAFHNAKILVVDDVADNRKLISEIFKHSNLQITQAENGLQAVEQVKQQTFDLILMDLRMPEMDGYEATSIIKTQTDTPVIALTASVMKDEHDRLKSNDFQGYLQKPVLKKKLISEMARFLPYEKKLMSQETIPNIMLSQSEQFNLELIMNDLQQLLRQCQQLKKHNQISEFQLFSTRISQLANLHPISILSDYANELKDNLDSYNIAALRRDINYFPELVEKLATLKQF